MNPDPSNSTSKSAADPALNPSSAAFNRSTRQAVPSDDLISLHSLYPPEMPEHPSAADYNDDYDDRDRQLLLDDLASDNDDFTRSSEEGWFYSDEDSGIDALPDSSDWED